MQHEKRNDAVRNQIVGADGSVIIAEKMKIQKTVDYALSKKSGEKKEVYTVLEVLCADIATRIPEADS